MKRTYYITGMTCAACSATVDRAIRSVKGVTDVSVNLLTGEATVISENVTDEQVTEAVMRAGYGCNDRAKPETKPDNTLGKRFWLSLVFLIPLFYISMAGMGFPLPDFIKNNLFLYILLQAIPAAAIGVINRDFFIRGFKSLFRFAPNMNALVAVGCTASGLYGLIRSLSLLFFEPSAESFPTLYFESFGMILTLVTLGKYLESRAEKKTTDGLKKLFDLAPKKTIVRRDGKAITVPVESVRIGETVLLRTGDRIPVDGTVLCGQAAVDTSVMTGESLPRQTTAGDSVLAATCVVNGYLEIRAEKVGSETALNGIVEFVKNAASSKAPIQRLADKVCGWFVPAVMAVALLTAAVWMILSGDVAKALTFAVCVLVIACPCALGIATPVAVAVAIGKGAENGILIRDAKAIENAARIDTVVFDKTGTLTAGRFEITRTVVLKGTEKELLRLAASAEAGSSHPIAVAVRNRAEGMTPEPILSLETVPGLGIVARTEKHEIAVGNHNLMKLRRIPALQSKAETGETPVWVADNGVLLGIFFCEDTLRASSAQTVERLKEMGVTSVMISGDTRPTAEVIAEKAGIDLVYADVLPTDKAEIIRRLQKDGKRVMMIGDGINDAPALVTADVGVAVGSGADIALESADMILVNPGVEDVVFTLTLGRETVKKIRQGLFWAFFYNTIGILLATGVLSGFGIMLTPAIAAAAMSLSSVCVISNALRLRSLSFIRSKEDGLMEIKLKVEGMHCDHCKAAVEKALRTVEGVSDVKVDLKKKSAVITAKDSVDTEALVKAVEEVGFEANVK